jgi:hypothetical protein
MAARPPLRLLLPTLAVLQLSLPPPAHAVWPHAPAVNLRLCTASAGQEYPTMVSDGAGGAIVAWHDYRGEYQRVYAQRVGVSGVPQWSMNGVALCSAGNSQMFPVAVSDGAGGAIVAWRDSRSPNPGLYAQRVSASGALQWGTSGVAVCTASGTHESLVMAADGAGGAILAWVDGRNAGTDIYAQRVSAAGVAQWPANGVAICSASGAQDSPSIVSDNAGGAVVVWLDQRTGTTHDVYAQRVNALGAPQWLANGRLVGSGLATLWNPTATSDGAGGIIAAWQEDRNGLGPRVYAERMDSAGNVLWGVIGVAVCTGSGIQQEPTLVPDGAGGAIVAWSDLRNGNGDLYVQRVNGSGAALWPASGVPVCTAVGWQGPTRMIQDGTGGAILAWEDPRIDLTYDPYVQRLSSAGAPQWTPDGVALTTATGAQQRYVIVPDGAAGVIAAWEDTRNAGWVLYAQRVERFGQLGNPEPVVTRVRDVPGDQGGIVQIEWTPSYLDTFPAFGIAQYSIWRQTSSAGPTSAGVSVWRASLDGVEASGWQQVGAQAARGLSSYSFAAPTPGDSVAGSNPLSTFMVMAEQAGGVPNWCSAADSGYSVDNLAPPAPQMFGGVFNGSAAILWWSASGAPDFSQFQLHRGLAADFIPGPGSMLATLVDAGYVDHTAQPYFYKLCALDVHGNRGPYALALPGGTLEAPGPPPPRELALSAPVPNPLRGSTTLRLSLPREARVSLAVFDQQGRRVRALLSGRLPAGEHRAAWDGRDDGGRRVASGIYFVRCEAGGRVLTRRVATLR